MGLFDRFTAKKPAPTPATATETPLETTQAAPPNPAVSVKARLVTAREKLDAKDLAGAVAIYDEVLAEAGDRADVLVTISGDLGANGNVAEIIDLIAPRYDAERHGPATGLNLLQAYLAVRNTDAAQHVLDILFSLKRPELEERLYGFSNAIAEMLLTRNHPTPETPEEAAQVAAMPKVGLITISKPIWFYGLESVADQLLPSKQGRFRRIAFAQLALPGIKDINEVINQPEDELGRLSRALPAWLAETFYFSPHYTPVAAVGIVTPPKAPTRFMIFGAEWTTENLRQLVDTTDGGLDYIVTGSLRAVAGDYEATLRVHEVKGFRERKRFTARWTPATANEELGKLHAEVRRYMEWSSVDAPLPYAAPASPRGWLETLGSSVALFVAEKGIIAPEFVPPIPPDLEKAAQQASASVLESLAYLTLRARAAKLGASAPAAVPLAASPVIEQAKQALG